MWLLNIGYSVEYQSKIHSHLGLDAHNLESRFYLYQLSS